MDVLLVVLLAIGIAMVAVGWLKSELKCPPPSIVYRFVPQNMIDTQFSESNNPSKVYKDMFEKSTVFLHARGIGDGKTIIPNKFA
jgi:hypothetical protein